MEIKTIGIIGRLAGGVEDLWAGFQSGWPGESVPQGIWMMKEDIPKVDSHCHAWLFLHYDAPEWLKTVSTGMRPVVARSLEWSQAGVPSVLVGDERVGELAGNYLAAKYPGDLVFFGPDFTFSRRRGSGFTASCKNASRPCTLFSDTEIESIVPNLPEGSGIFACTDFLARRCVDVALAAGRSVPGDLAIVGVDNAPIPAEGSQLRLTTIPIPLQKQGEMLAKTLFALAIGNSVPVRQDALPDRILIRDSA